MTPAEQKSLNAALDKAYSAEWELRIKLTYPERWALLKAIERLLR